MLRSIARKAYTIAADRLDRAKRGGLYRATGTGDVGRHLMEAAQWLARAQDAGSNRGIAYGTDFGGPFLESYPETTGYIIPTFLELSQHLGDPAWVERAVAAGEWECDVQMPEGAVMGGILNSNPTPAVFNTGMVLLGWAALQRHLGEGRWTASTRRAADWLLANQDPDGCWRRGNSRFATSTTTLYNVKAAWGLCEAGTALDYQPAIDGAVRNAEFAVSRQRPNGWFSENCLSDANRPLLHTTAYVMQGLMGIGRLTGREDFISAAQRAADALISVMREDGFLAGRHDAEWRNAVASCCLTGSAQTGIVWGQLYQQTGDVRYREALGRVNGYLMRHHDIANADPALRGGVPGSWPVWGEYGRLKILNWATNFFVESLLMQHRLAAGAVAHPAVPSADNRPT
jgi:hypothetical protein